MKITAVDFSEHALQKARKRLKAAGEPAISNVTFQQADALQLHQHLAAQQFDCLLDSALLHCLQPAAQKQYVRSLTPHVCPLSKPDCNADVELVQVQTRHDGTSERDTVFWRIMHTLQF